MSEIDSLIKSEIDSANIVLFMKGTPAFPQCGFSGQVVQILLLVCLLRVFHKEAYTIFRVCHVSDVTPSRLKLVYLR